MTGPLILKSVCFKCKINKWIVDFKEGCAAKISTTSVCLACEHATKIERLEKTLQEKDVMINKLTNILEKLEKKVETLGKDKIQVNNLDLRNNEEVSSHDLGQSSNQNIQKTVKVIENAVKENMDIIAENGKAIVEIRNDLVKLVNEPEYRKASGRSIVKHPKIKQNNCSIIVSNRYAVLAQEDTLLIGDSIVRDQGNHLINKNKQRRKLKALPGSKVGNIIEEVKSLENKRSRYVIVHAGSKDLCLGNRKTFHSEPVIAKLETLADSLFEKTERGIMIGLLPRIYSNHLDLSKTIGVNERMNKYCKKKGVEFLDVWNAFIGKKHLFMNDGIHLNTLGNIKLGELIDKKCNNFPIGKSSSETNQSPTIEEKSKVDPPQESGTTEDSFLGFQ